MANILGLLAKYQKDSNERFFEELFNYGGYRKARGKTDLVVIDIGALAGEFCAYIYDQAKVIYAIEPYTPHYVELAKNIDEFGLEKIKSFEVGLSDTNGTGYLNGNESRGSNMLTDEKKYAIKTKTLATFMKEQGIEHVDILKIDIESGETRVFATSDFPEVANKIDLIIGEHLNLVREKIMEQGFNEEIDGGNYIFRRNNG